LVIESLREYVNNVVKIQYLLGDKTILPNMIWDAIAVHEESREAVNLLSQIYSKRRQDPLRQVLSDTPFKARVDGLHATLTSAGRPASTADDAMAALHVVSVFLFDGGQGAWKVFLNIASTYVMALLENTRYHRNYTAALQACGPKDEFIVKTTIWFDVIGSITTQEQPRLLCAIRELFDPGRSFIGGYSSPSTCSMMSPMGCENVVVWALAEASSLSCWKRSNKRKGTLNQRELVRKVEDIEIHLEPQPPLPQPLLESPEDWSRLLISRIFRSATKLFLQSILHGDHPRVPELRRCVDETFKCILDFPSPVADIKPAIVRSTVFGIFICGSLMDDPVKKRLLAVHLQQETGSDGVGNTSTVLRLLQQLWETRKRSPRSSVPWREQLKEAQVLLV
jgi:C6 transcription factor Pro1